MDRYLPIPNRRSWRRDYNRYHPSSGNLLLREQRTIFCASLGKLTWKLSLFPPEIP